jgi:hypothetical protein
MIMNARLKNFLAYSTDHRSIKEVITWWEQRRLFYNAAMFVAGSVTILIAILLGEIAFSDVKNALPPILIFALCANLFYTMGWITEIACRKMMPEKEFVQKSGPVLLVAGICLSVFVTIAFDITIVIAFIFEN